MNEIISKRLKNIRNYLEEKGLECFMVSQADNRRYLSGFTGSAGALFVSRQRAILATDFRYVEQSKIQAPLFEIVMTKGDTANWLPGLVSSLNINSMGFEAEDIPYASVIQIVDAMSKGYGEVNIKGEGTNSYIELVDSKTEGRSFKIVPTQAVIVGIRAKKDSHEMKLIRQAVSLTDEAFAHLPGFLRPGLSEKAVAWELEKFMRDKGSESMPFDIIVASGPNAALPHHHPSERLIQAGEPIIVDMGAKIDGYASDLTRTFCMGTPDETYKKVYGITLLAQQNAIDNVKSGTTGGQVDALARSIIEEAGYGDKFGHGLGHGVGGAVHEDPRLGPGAQSPVETDMAFTIEPGIYLPGWGGVRIEDDVYLTTDGPEILSHSSRSMFVGLERSIIKL